MPDSAGALLRLDTAMEPRTITSSLSSSRLGYGAARDWFELRTAAF